MCWVKLKPFHPYPEHCWQIPEKLGLAAPFFHLRVKFSNLICCRIPARILILWIPLGKWFFSPHLCNTAHCSQALSLLQSSWGLQPGLPVGVPPSWKIKHWPGLHWGHLITCFPPCCTRACNFVTQRSGQRWHVRPWMEGRGLGEETLSSLCPATLVVRHPLLSLYDPLIPSMLWNSPSCSVAKERPGEWRRNLIATPTTSTEVCQLLWDSGPGLWSLCSAIPGGAPRGLADHAGEQEWIRRTCSALWKDSRWEFGRLRLPRSFLNVHSLSPWLVRGTVSGAQAAGRCMCFPGLLLQGPQDGWPKTTKIDHFTVLEVRSPKSRCQQDRALWNTLGEGVFHIFLLASGVASHPWHSLCQYHTVTTIVAL